MLCIAYFYLFPEVDPLASLPPSVLLSFYQKAKFSQKFQTTKEIDD